jgi:ketosteroid isomerase-like protein
MAEENVDIVRRVYEGWTGGDFSNVDDFDPDIEFEMADWPHQTKVTGIEAMWETWRSTLGAFEGFRSMPTDFTAYGDNVLVLNRIEASGKESGAGVGADVATVFRVLNGKIVRLALYWDADAARREAAAQD